MKFLIWFGTILVTALVTTAARAAGIALGGIPTFILYLVMFGVAGGLCKAYDERQRLKGTPVNRNTNVDRDKDSPTLGQASVTPYCTNHRYRNKDWTTIESFLSSTLCSTNGEKLQFKYRTTTTIYRSGSCEIIYIFDSYIKKGRKYSELFVCDEYSAETTVPPVEYRFSKDLSVQGSDAPNATDDTRLAPAKSDNPTVTKGELAVNIFGKSSRNKKGSLDLGIDLEYLNGPRSLNYQVSCKYLRELFLTKELPAAAFKGNDVFARAVLEKVIQKCSEEGYSIPPHYNQLPLTYVSNHDESCFGYIVEFDDVSKECDCNFVGMLVKNGEKAYYTSEYYAGLDSFSICCFCENGGRLIGIGDESPRTFEEFKQALTKSGATSSNLYTRAEGTATPVAESQSTSVRSDGTANANKKVDAPSATVSNSYCTTDSSKSAYVKIVETPDPIIPKEEATEMPEPEIRFCRICRANLIPNSRFCNQCGTAVAEGPEVPKCTKCGGAIPEDSKFCPFCGEKIEVNFGPKCTNCGNMLPEDSLFCHFCGAEIRPVAIEEPAQDEKRNDLEEQEQALEARESALSAKENSLKEKERELVAKEEALKEKERAMEARVAPPIPVVSSKPAKKRWPRVLIIIAAVVAAAAVTVFLIVPSIKAKEQAKQESHMHTYSNAICTVCGQVFTKKYTGSGSSTIAGLTLENGDYEFKVTHTGRENFFVGLKRDGASTYERIIRKTGPFESYSHIVTVDAQHPFKNALISITADGRWTLEITAIKN